MDIRKIQEMIRNKLTGNIGKEKILLLALAGILLIAASYFEKGGDYNLQEETTTDLVGVEHNYSSAEYQKQMENKVKRLIESIKGISDATVVITLKSGSEQVLQEDSENSNSSKKTGNDSDSSGTVKKTTVIFNRDGNESPYVIKEKYPEVEGIAVAAKGVSGNTGETKKEEIINMLAALFNVPVHKISVLEIN